MRPGVRSLLVLTLAVAAGTWAGVTHPEWTSRAIDRASTAVAKPSSSASSPDPSATDPEDSRAGATPAGPEHEFAPLPQASHPEAMPERAPWPALNPEANVAKAWSIAEGPKKIPGSERRAVTLTFDDGPFPETTPAVLKLLARHRVKATFFVIGRYLDGTDARAEATRAVLRRAVASGHQVGNHTHDHHSLVSVSHTEVLAQIDEGTASIERATGRRPILFRPPFGMLDAFSQEAVAERRLDTILWSVEAQDMERTDPQAMFKDLVRQLERKQGGIILLHDIRKSSVEVLARLLDWLKRHRFDPRNPERPGYAIVDLPQYLREVGGAEPPRPAIVDAKPRRTASH